MFPDQANFRRLVRRLPLALALGICGWPGVASARTFTVLHFFKNASGARPNGGLIADASGNLYGTTGSGGGGLGGTVFKLAPDGRQTVLFSFCGGDNCADGSGPAGGLVRDGDGNLYGATNYGGSAADGLVFALSRNGTETVLHQFSGGSDGKEPVSGLLRNKKGHLFGTTLLGGSSGCGGYGCGTVFEIAPDGSERVLYAFTGAADGAWPYAGLIADGDGNIYGTASYGGADNDGVVFELTGDGTQKVLHNFRGGTDGRTPVAALYRDNAGNLYGTTDNGGEYGVGIVFRLAPDGTETVLHTFGGKPDGANPDAALISGGAGKLFGTTWRGGHGGRGAIFEIGANGSERVLYSFHGTSDGKNPFGSVTVRAGNIYGVTPLGGPQNKGVAFALLK